MEHNVTKECILVFFICKASIGVRNAGLLRLNLLSHGLKVYILLGDNYKDDHANDLQDLVAGSHIAGSRNSRPLTPWAL